MISHDGITCSLISKGAPLLETSIDQHNPMFVFCEATFGDEFVVKVEGKMPSYHDLMLKCYMDGIWVGEKWYHRKHCKQFSAKFCGVHLPNDPTKQQLFKFSGIQLTGQSKFYLMVYSHTFPES